MDVELFKKVMPRHFLDSIWSQWDNRANEHLAPTIHATMTHFNRVVECIVTTCIGDPSMMAQDRARVVEFWIQVAKECQGLRNLSSLHAILWALQSPSVHHLKKTWRRVSRKNARKFKNLMKTDQRESRKLLKEEVTSVRATLEMDPQGAQERQQQQGLVPFLGTFLNHLKLLDIGMEDDLEKLKVIRRIQLLQQAANAYDLEPDERFGAWFQAMEPISVRESYCLSCQLEPAHQKASKMRLFKRKRNGTSSSSGPTATSMARSRHTLETTSAAPRDQQGHWGPRGALGQLFPPE
ncbi:ral guanine nucleotide dissociation stimulator-like [Diceros bicornis minor]|uniref:ral guanine nucleotide dissociation stimulator-like n=1 Tax=Diceros bicornis minor TaxID=77932 RepID=UPI0026F2E2BC|nr:ral guanine nucleotide dissociation stimulator-like [Diceros bicornis minor]